MAILPDFDAAQFDRGARIDNPFFPVHPGTIRSYSGSKVDEETGEVDTESNDVFETFDTKEIQGVQTVVSRDTAYANGVLIEDTIDFFAQDTEGNVWYFGEVAYNYEYDDEGNYIGTNNDGSWEAGVNGAQPGWIMKAEPGFGAAYFQEFAPGVAEDEGIVVALNQEVTTGQEQFDGVLKTLDTTALEPDVAEFKYYAPGVGQIRADEELNEDGEPQLVIELQGTRVIGNDNNHDRVETPDVADFESDGSDFIVTFLSEDSELNNSLGAYTIDTETGEIGEGRILFTGTDDIEESVSVTVDEGEALGLFLVPDGGELGLEISEFEDGGLFFRSILTGQPATIEDGQAPLVTNAEGDALPVPAFHALGNQNGFNFLNPAAGVHAAELDPDTINADGNGTVLGFEDALVTDPDFDGDYDDLVVAVSRAPLSAESPDALPGDLGTPAEADIMIA